ncbi:MAG: endonuclease domain-containing protein [Gemmatimonadales bacterium]
MSCHAEPVKRAAARQMRSNPTYAEQAAWEILRDRRCLGLKFRRQYPVRGFIVDFYCPALRVAIELDGPVRNSDAAQSADAERSTVLSVEQIAVVRIRNEAVSAECIAHELTQFLDRRRWP